jgi:hypothetical protein
MIYRKFVYILHYNIHKRLKTKTLYEIFKPNVIMEHLQICDWQIICLYYALWYNKKLKTRNFMELKSNVVMEHL